MRNLPTYEEHRLNEAHKSDEELERSYPDATAYRVAKHMQHGGEIGFDFGDSPGSLPLLYFLGGKTGYYHPSDLKRVSVEDAADEYGWDEDEEDDVDEAVNEGLKPDQVFLVYAYAASGKDPARLVYVVGANDKKHAKELVFGDKLFKKYGCNRTEVQDVREYAADAGGGEEKALQTLLRGGPTRVGQVVYDSADAG